MRYNNLYPASLCRDKIEFEVMWLTPEKFWGDSETSAVIEPLDLEGEIEKFGRDLKGGS